MAPGGDGAGRAGAGEPQPRLGTGRIRGSSPLPQTACPCGPAPGATLSMAQRPPALGPGGPAPPRRSSHPALPHGTAEGHPPPLTARRGSLAAPVASRRSSVVLGGGAKRLSNGPWVPGARVSFSGLPLFPPVPEACCQNTYRTQPAPGCRFHAGPAQRVLEATLAARLQGVAYTPGAGRQLAQSLAEQLRGQLKELAPPRYKLVCSVVLGQAGRQGLRVASRALWDPESDTFASATFTNASLFAVATVHGLYYE
ncbi:PREDICTED: tctex1 domain-containing protein 4 isoform X2 [Crocodylus porosus]|uniref:tctex1 domain-containing protein 4 isoform X2 n=1 Tax=Crocodylus porosus TaxID=8502 RepID=UPI00094057BA|nr:PREDICTED: tctex1 domain-containing protein 4 isoform X2 [Crocodylus porosus]